MFYISATEDLINLMQTCRIYRLDLKPPMKDRFRIAFDLANGETVEEIFSKAKDRDTAYEKLLSFMQNDDSEGNS